MRRHLAHVAVVSDFWRFPLHPPDVLRLFRQLLERSQDGVRRRRFAAFLRSLSLLRSPLVSQATVYRVPFPTLARFIQATNKRPGGQSRSRACFKISNAASRNRFQPKTAMAHATNHVFGSCNRFAHSSATFEA